MSTSATVFWKISSDLWYLSSFGRLKFFLRRARQNSRKSFAGMPMFCRLFLFPVKGIWNSLSVRGKDNNIGVL